MVEDSADGNRERAEFHDEVRGIHVNLGEEAKKAFDEVLRSRGRVNILIAGRVGVGKSTLVNAVFQGRLAETGQGRPITPNTREITKEGIPVSIFDTRGLELTGFKDTLGALESLVKSRRAEPDPHRHIHVAWICIAEDLRRVEEAESSLVTLLALYMPVLGVITKARADQGFKRIVQDLLPEAKNIVRVRVLKEEFDDGHILAPMGLQNLVELTMEVVPEGQKNAFAAAQKVSLTGAGATISGRAIVANLLKFIPGGGTFVGIAIAAPTAALLTTAFGEAYIAVLVKLFAENNGEAPKPEDILNAFKGELRKRLR